MKQSVQNHMENKDKEIPGILLNVNAIQTNTKIPDYMRV